jgi:hypothetical protein
MSRWSWSVKTRSGLKSLVICGCASIRLLVSILVWSLRAVRGPRAALVLENLASRVWAGWNSGNWVQEGSEEPRTDSSTRRGKYAKPQTHGVAVRSIRSARRARMRTAGATARRPSNSAAGWGWYWGTRSALAHHDYEGSNQHAVFVLPGRGFS